MNPDWQLVSRGPLCFNLCLGLPLFPGSSGVFYLQGLGGCLCRCTCSQVCRACDTDGAVQMVSVMALVK